MDEREAGASRALLLTGRPGVGKTTAVRRVVERLGGEVAVRGFYTEEVREAGRRVGFRGVPFGRRGPVTADARLIAHVDFGPPNVSRYGVDVEAVDALTRHTLEPAPPDPDALERTLHVVDEIGKMECYSDRFVAAVRRLLEVGRPLFGTVSSRGGGFMREAREWEGSVVWEVTRENRDGVPERVVEWLRGQGRR